MNKDQPIPSMLVADIFIKEPEFPEKMVEKANLNGIPATSCRISRDKNPLAPAKFTFGFSGGIELECKLCLQPLTSVRQCYEMLDWMFYSLKEKYKHQLSQQ